MKLDFSKFQVADCDDHTTTLKHYAGHSIRIVHKALSREHKDAIEGMRQKHLEKKSKKMADGGKVPIPETDKTQPKTPPPMPKIDVQGASGRTWEDVKNTMMNPKSWYAEGGEVEGQPDDSSMGQALSNMGMQPQMVNIPGVNPSASMTPPQSPPTMGQVISDVGNILMSPPGSKQAEQPAWSLQNAQAQQDPSMQQGPQAQAPQQMGMAPQPSINPQAEDPMGMKTYLKSAQESLDLQQQAAQKEYQAASQMGAQKAAADLTYQGQMQRMQNQFNTDVEANMKNVASTIEDIRNSHINPKAYQENMSTGEKVSSAIGMIAGGLGQGFIGGPNPAVEFLNKQIDRDIHAQEYNINKKTTLLNAYQAQFRDKMAANQMTRATLNVLYSSKLDMAAHQAATPAAQANLLKTSGELKMKAADLTRQATLNEYMYGLGNTGGTGQGGAPGNAQERENVFRRQQSFLMMTNPELAKARAAAHVPGIGDAPLGSSVPDGVKKEFASHQNFDKAAQNLYNFVKQHRGSMSSLHPVDKARAEQMAIELQSLFRERTLNTVYREGEKPLLDKAVSGNPISMLNYFTELPKLEELMKSNARAENSLRQVHGLPQREEPTPGAIQEGQIMIGKDGRQYRRQGAYMIPVK